MRKYPEPHPTDGDRWALQRIEWDLVVFRIQQAVQLRAAGVF